MSALDLVKLSTLIYTFIFNTIFMLLSVSALNTVLLSLLLSWYFFCFEVLLYIFFLNLVVGMIIVLKRAAYTNKSGWSFDVLPPGLCCLASCC